MWKREEPVRPAASVKGTSQQIPGGSAETAKRSSRAAGSLGRDVVNIGKSVVINGELSGSEDLTIEGKVDGKIDLRQHVLTIGPHGKIKAQVFAKSVVVMGEVIGNIAATDKINIRESGSVDGDVTAPRIAIFEGARFRGSIDMQQSKASTVPSEVTSVVKVAAGPAPAAVDRTARP